MRSGLLSRHASIQFSEGGGGSRTGGGVRGEEFETANRRSEERMEADLLPSDWLAAAGA